MEKVIKLKAILRKKQYEKGEEDDNSYPNLWSLELESGKNSDKMFNDFLGETMEEGQTIILEYHDSTEKYQKTRVNFRCKSGPPDLEIIKEGVKNLIKWADT